MTQKHSLLAVQRDRGVDDDGFDAAEHGEVAGGRGGGDGGDVVDVAAGRGVAQAGGGGKIVQICNDMGKMLFCARFNEIILIFSLTR